MLGDRPASLGQTSAFHADRGPSTTESRHGSTLQLGGGAAAGAFGHERDERAEHVCLEPKMAISRPDPAEICSEADRPHLGLRGRRTRYRRTPDLAAQPLQLTFTFEATLRGSFGIGPDVCKAGARWLPKQPYSW